LALALTGVVYAVDGVALKQAVDAWASAPAAEKATRFANAEAIRWLEWGVRSYQDLMLGLALVLYAIVIVWTASPVLVDRHDYHQVLTELPRVAGGTRAADAVRIPLQDLLA
jgi:hypothetical protein